VTAFKELEGKETRSLEDFVAVFDVCHSERRYVRPLPFFLFMHKYAEMFIRKVSLFIFMHKYVEMVDTHNGGQRDAAPGGLCGRV
jgi:hypothetical protein